MRFGILVKIDLSDQGQLPFKMIGIVNKVINTPGPNLLILAWTGYRCYRTDKHFANVGWFWCHVSQEHFHGDTPLNNKKLLAGDDGDVKTSVTDIVKKPEQDGGHLQDSVKVYYLDHPWYISRLESVCFCVAYWNITPEIHISHKVCFCLFSKISFFKLFNANYNRNEPCWCSMGCTVFSLFVSMDVYVC